MTTQCIERVVAIVDRHNEINAKQVKTFICDLKNILY